MYGAHPARYWVYNKYWFDVSSIVAVDYDSRDYRRFTFTEEHFKYTYRFQYRIESPEVFESKWIILRYNKWIVISVSWFQPDKGVKKRQKKTRTFNRIMLNSNRGSHFAKTSKLFRRLATISNHLSSKGLATSKNYAF